MASQSPRSAHDLSISALLSPSAPEPASVIRALLHRHIDEAMQSLPPRGEVTDVGLVTQIGDTIIHLQDMLARIADELVDDRFVRSETHRVLAPRSADGGDIEDGMLVRRFDKSYMALKYDTLPALCHDLGPA